MNHSKLDLAFVLDTTGSMGSYIEHAKNVSHHLDVKNADVYIKECYYIVKEYQ